MTPTTRFLWGFAGSIAVELVMFLQGYYQIPIQVPERYKQWPFLVARLALAIVGGGLAVAYAINTEILAVNVGAATPAIVLMFAENAPQDINQPNQFPTKSTTKVD